MSPHDEPTTAAAVPTGHDDTGAQGTGPENAGPADTGAGAAWLLGDADSGTVTPSTETPDTEAPDTGTTASWDAVGVASPDASAGTDDALARDELLLAGAPSTVSPEQLDRVLNSPPPSARSLRLTKVLGVGLLMAMGFFGGVFAQQQWGQSAAATQAGGRTFPGGLASAEGGFPSGVTPSGFPGGTGTAGGSGSAGQGGATTTGTVKLVDGDVLYVTTKDGTVTRVVMSDDTTVSKTASATSIDKGDTVTVNGQTTDGGVTATSVTVTK